MEITALTIVGYLIAGLAAARLLLGIPPLKDNALLVWVVFALFLLCWPLWAPVASFFRLRAARARPAYMGMLGELDELSADYDSLGAQTDALLEELAQAGDAQSIGALLAELDQKTRARQEVRSRFEEVRAQARGLQASNESWWDLKPPGHLNTTGVIRPALSPAKAAEAEVTRILLRTFSYDEDGDDWDRDAVSSELREFLASFTPPEPDAPVIRAAIGVSKYMRPAPARSRTWEAVFTSSFRKSLKKAGRDIEEKAIAAIADLVVNPVEPRGSTIKPLTGNHKGLWRYRIGEFRLVYQPVADAGELRLISLTHRSQAY